MSTAQEALNSMKSRENHMHRAKELLNQAAGELARAAQCGCVGSEVLKGVNGQVQNQRNHLQALLIAEEARRSMKVEDGDG